MSIFNNLPETSLKTSPLFFKTSSTLLTILFQIKKGKKLFSLASFTKGRKKPPTPQISAYSRCVFLAFC